MRSKRLEKVVNHLSGMESRLKERVKTQKKELSDALGDFKKGIAKLKARIDRNIRK